MKNAVAVSFQVEISPNHEGDHGDGKPGNDATAPLNSRGRAPTRSSCVTVSGCWHSS